MFNENILKSIKNNKVIIDHINDNWNYDMYDFIKYVNSHPNEFKMWEPNNRRLGILKMESRASTPDFAKTIIKDLKHIFHKNYISCHAYCGFTKYSKSFNIHKDRMDVLYLQVIGTIKFSIWESDLDEKEIKSEQGKCILKQDFIPGDWVWIPRGTYHLIEPIDPRVAFSFGVENNPKS